MAFETSGWVQGILAVFRGFPLLRIVAGNLHAIPPPKCVRTIRNHYRIKNLFLLIIIVVIISYYYKASEK